MRRVAVTAQQVPPNPHRTSHPSTPSTSMIGLSARSQDTCAASAGAQAPPAAVDPDAPDVDLEPGAGGGPPLGPPGCRRGSARVAVDAELRGDLQGPTWSARDRFAGPGVREMWAWLFRSAFMHGVHAWRPDGTST